MRQAFPEIPVRDLTPEDVVRIIGEAAILDRAKTACGMHAVTWTRRVKKDLGKPDCK